MLERLQTLAFSLLMLAVPRGLAAEGWTTHQDPSGFSVQLPAGWRVLSDMPGALTFGDAQSRWTALVRARRARGDLARWLQQEYPASEPGMQALRIDSLRTEGSDIVHAALQYRNPQGLAKRARLVAVRRGDIVTIFVAATPADEQAQGLPVLSRVLDSLRFGAPRIAAGGAGSGAAAAPLAYARWVDPREGAFAVELPAGWRTEGGLQRTTWNRRVAYQSASPDGRALLFNGDASLPRMFILPNEITARYGGGMNQNWSPDAQIVAPFQSAEQMGAWLVRQRFGGEPTGTRPRPDLVEIVRRNPLLTTGVSTATAADVEFRLPDGRIGVLTLTTFGSVTPGVGGSWWADNVHGFIAPPQQAGQLGRALAHMVATIQVNPAWDRGERQHELRLGQQYTAYLQYSQRLQQQTIEQRWASEDAIQRSRRDLLGGTVRLQDPQTGEVFETQARERYYYRVVAADRPTALGTEVDASPLPQIDLRRLLTVGVDVPDR